MLQFIICNTAIIVIVFSFQHDLISLNTLLSNLKTAVGLLAEVISAMLQSGCSSPSYVPCQFVHVFSFFLKFIFYFSFLLFLKLFYYFSFLLFFHFYYFLLFFFQLLNIKISILLIPHFLVIFFINYSNLPHFFSYLKLEFGIS